jgi:chromosome segregation ATPase
MLNASSKQNERRYDTPLYISLSVSCLGIMFGTWLTIRNGHEGGLTYPIMTVCFGLIPLLWYHFSLLKNAKFGLSQQAIDSVYYLGFLVTLMSLSACAIEIAIQGDKIQLNTVVLQFGLGLLATGYAIFARITLIASAKGSEEQSAEDVFDTYLIKSRDLVNQFEMAAASYESLHLTIKSRTENIINDSLNALQLGLKASTESFQSGIESSMQLAKESAEQLHALIDAVAFEDERKALASSVKKTITQVDRLNGVFNGLTENLNLTNEQTEKLNNNFNEANEAGHKIKLQFDAIAQTPNPLAVQADGYQQIASRIGVGTQQIVQMQERLQDVLNSMSPLAKQVQVLCTTFEDESTVIAESSHTFKSTTDAIKFALSDLGVVVAKTNLAVQGMDVNVTNASNSLIALGHSQLPILKHAAQYEESAHLMASSNSQMASTLAFLEPVSKQLRDISQQCLLMGQDMPALQNVAKGVISAVSEINKSTLGLVDTSKALDVTFGGIQRFVESTINQLDTLTQINQPVNEIQEQFKQLILVVKQLVIDFNPVSHSSLQLQMALTALQQSAIESTKPMNALPQDIEAVGAQLRNIEATLLRFNEAPAMFEHKLEEQVNSLTKVTERISELSVKLLAQPVMAE